MASISLLDYAGLALLYAAIGTALVWGSGRAAGLPSTTQALPLALAVLFFVALTQHPLPDRQALAQACPIASARPNLVPFDFVPYVIGRWQDYGAVQAFLMERSAVVFAMNFILCGAIGLAASRLRIPVRRAALPGFALSLLVELTQLTGAWGLYACAWRKFDVDDLILNTAGIAAGALLGSRLRRRRPAPAA